MGVQRTLRDASGRLLPLPKSLMRKRTEISRSGYLLAKVDVAGSTPVSRSSLDPMHRVTQARISRFRPSARSLRRDCRSRRRRKACRRMV